MSAAVLSYRENPAGGGRYSPPSGARVKLVHQSPTNNSAALARGDEHERRFTSAVCRGRGTGRKEGRKRKRKRKRNGRVSLAKEDAVQHLVVPRYTGGPDRCVPPALVQLFGVNDLFNHAEPMKTSTFLVQVLTRKRLPLLKDQGLPFWEFVFYVHQNVPEPVWASKFFEHFRKMNWSSALSAVISANPKRSAMYVEQEPRRFTMWRAFPQKYRYPSLWTPSTCFVVCIQVPKNSFFSITWLLRNFLHCSKKA